jgi:hypothetical protein
MMSQSLVEHLEEEARACRGRIIRATYEKGTRVVEAPWTLLRKW